jgi:hypothetical protein
MGDSYIYIYESRQARLIGIMPKTKECGTCKHKYQSSSINVAYNHCCNEMTCHHHNNKTFRENNPPGTINRYVEIWRGSCPYDWILFGLEECVNNMLPSFLGVWRPYDAIAESSQDTSGEDWVTGSHNPHTRCATDSIYIYIYIFTFIYIHRRKSRGFERCGFERWGRLC